MPAAKKKPVAKKPASPVGGPARNASASVAGGKTVAPEPPITSSPPAPLPSAAEEPVRPLAPAVEASVPSTETEEPVNLEQMLEDSAVEEPPLEKTNKVLFALGTVIALGLIAGSIAIFFLYLSHPKQVTRQETTPVEEATPSATPVSATNKSDITVEVLNGSGVAGTAGKAAATLASLGYTIGKTGNAEKRLAKSEVFIGTHVKEDGVAMLLVDLERAFSITSSSGVLEDSTFSARLIIGKQ